MRTSFAGLFGVLVFACTCFPATSASLHVWQGGPNLGPPYAD